MKRRVFLSGLGATTALGALPARAVWHYVAWWSLRRIATGFATRGMRRALLPGASVLGSGTIAKAADDYINGVIREPITRGFDHAFPGPQENQRIARGLIETRGQRHYFEGGNKPRVDGSGRIVDYSIPRGAGVITQADAPAPVEKLSTFSGVFDLALPNDVLAQGQALDMWVEDVDTLERTRLAPLIVGRKQAETGLLGYELSTRLAPGRKTLKAFSELRPASSCGDQYDCGIFVSDVFFVHRV